MHGITREVVLDISRSHFETIEEKLPYEALSSVDEVFITATNKEVMPVAQIDQYSFKVGEITQFLMEEFQKYAFKAQIKSISHLYMKNAFYLNHRRLKRACVKLVASVRS